MLSLDDFKAYYDSHDFVIGLCDYFTVLREDGYLVIPSMGKHSDYEPHHSFSSPFEENEYKKNHMKANCFAIIFYYASLCNYAINEIAGKDALVNFLKSIQWPLIRCGTDGIMEPQQTLNEADLVYHHNSKGCQDAYGLFQEVIPFMKKELNDFFAGRATNFNQAAYDEFVAAMKGKTEKFWELANAEIQRFRFYKNA